jgi:CreA protein
MKKSLLTLLALSLSFSVSAKQIGEVTTSGVFFKDTIAINSFADPTLKGIACHVTAPDKSFSTEDPTDSSITCRQISNVIIGDPTENQTDVFSDSKGLFFKSMRVDRFYDAEFNTLIYISYVKKSSGNNASHSVSSVPLYSAKILAK